MTFGTGDLVLVDTHTLRGAQDGDQTRKFAARWVGPFAFRARLNARAHTLELPPEWRCHKTINVGFLKKFRESATWVSRSRKLGRTAKLTFTHKFNHALRAVGSLGSVRKKRGIFPATLYDARYSHANEPSENSSPPAGLG